MILGKRFQNYHCDQYKSDEEKDEGIRTMSLMCCTMKLKREILKRMR